MTREPEQAHGEHEPGPASANSVQISFFRNFDYGPALEETTLTCVVVQSLIKAMHIAVRGKLGVENKDKSNVKQGPF